MLREIIRIIGFLERIKIPLVASISVDNWIKELVYFMIFSFVISFSSFVLILLCYDKKFIRRLS